ncbi:SAM-dependent methyltransferase [Polynucleobacter sp. Latsch14-2]|jgi:SAM-dependent methyltransferase|uniref:class I SAM-dependent methyltransferase n=1 Tax=Polynucleobacter sp. Latsch14-2 TaxID=2576920 RepID=UPI001C0DA84E|nr:SAM-dependent methyltransferase [Polynucleobacter sp. Latsch14-2]MBU3614350.1 SAM-dependent methyltransferase [Polynucleobacter sp. Latsch14-2]
MSSLHAGLTDASAWLKRFAPAIPKDGMVLDLAAGSGRHSIYLAKLGYCVLAVDRDFSALEPLEDYSIEIALLDLEGEKWPLQNRQFSGIVVSNYLYRPYLDLLPEMLLEGGVLIYETFAHGNAEFGKPSNPHFLLNPGELLSLADRHGLQVLAYEDIYVDRPKPARIQRICAVKGSLKGRIPLQFVG